MLAEHDDVRDDDPYLLEEALGVVESQADKAVAFFYAMLFVENPGLREMFPLAMDQQRDRLFRALTSAVRGLRADDRSVTLLRQLGRDHRKYGVVDEHYPAVGRALLAALRKYADDVWVDELESVWWRCYGYMSRVMIESARDAGEQPAVWNGSIVAHERRALDLAVITLRMDRPYPYRAGQFATVETPYRPRMWRQYSLAAAPTGGPAGEELVELHVKAIDGGWVSGPLVWRAQIGDTLRLGPARGDLAIDRESPRDVLLIAGGTGLAPLKAVVEDATTWNRERRLTLFFGARRSHDLYDLAALHRLAGRNPWLRVVPCVSEDPSYVGDQGLLADVVARHGRDHDGWRGHDVLLCGSPSMVRATLRSLAESGVPSERICFDAFGEVDRGGAEVVDLRQARRSATRSR